MSAGRLFTNVAELVADQAAQRPTRARWSSREPYAGHGPGLELDAQITAVAAGLVAHGWWLDTELAGPNSIEFVVAYLAALRAGYVAVPMNTQSTAEDARDAARLRARVLFVSPDHHLSNSDFGAVHLVPLSPDGLAALAETGRDEVSSPQDREALAVLLYTAGTSGRPKAAMLSHRALLSHLEQVGTFAIIDQGDDRRRTALVSRVRAERGPGRLAVRRCPARGCRRHADDFFDIVRDEGVTNLPVSPCWLESWLPIGWSMASATSAQWFPVPHRFGTISGSRSPSARAASEQGYGLTEAGPGVSATLGGPLLGHGHVGRALPGVEIRDW